MKLRVLFAALCLLNVGPVSALTVYGAGLESCGKFLEARKQDGLEEIEFLFWFGGYLTAVNKDRPEGSPILGGTDMAGAMYWLENYCRKNPTQPFFGAAFAFVSDRAALLSQPSH